MEGTIMAATIRPSLILNMDVDERQYSDDLVAEIKHSYSYVAPSVVAPVAASDGEPIEHTIRLVVRMHHPYWDANDEASQGQWAAGAEAGVAPLMFAPEFTVERGCWGIEYADGTEHLFDSAAEAFLA